MTGESEAIALPGGDPEGLFIQSAIDKATEAMQQNIDFLDDQLATDTNMASQRGEQEPPQGDPRGMPPYPSGGGQGKAEVGIKKEETAQEWTLKKTNRGMALVHGNFEFELATDKTLEYLVVRINASIASYERVLKAALDELADEREKREQAQKDVNQLNKLLEKAKYHMAAIESYESFDTKLYKEIDATLEEWKEVLRLKPDLSTRPAVDALKDLKRRIASLSHPTNFILQLVYVIDAALAKMGETAGKEEVGSKN